MILKAKISRVITESDYKFNPEFGLFLSNNWKGVVRILFSTIDYPEDRANEFMINCKNGILDHYSEFNQFNNGTFQTLIRVDPQIYIQSELDIVIHW